MPERQLRFFRRPQPLVERLGAQFFREVPRGPGVYLMRDAKQRLLYVGKSGNLRQRLGTYRCLTERTSRKTVRLLHAVENISWELCASEPAACLRENKLLRQHRPRFNRVNTYPQAYPYVELSGQSGGFALRLTLVATEHSFGAFKCNVRAALAACFRLLWARFHAADDYAALPRAMLLARPPREWNFAANGFWFTALQDFMGGNADSLLRELENNSSPDSPEFYRQFRQSDIEMLTRFYARGPQRNRKILDSMNANAAATCIAQEQLDDLFVVARSMNGN